MLLLYSFIAVMLQLHFSPKISNMCSLGHIDSGGMSKGLSGTIYKQIYKSCNEHNESLCSQQHLGTCSRGMQLCSIGLVI